MFNPLDILSAFNPAEWFHYLANSIWQEVWKYGTGVAILILSGAVVVFNPLGLRNAAISVFFLTALTLAVYSWGAKDGGATARAECAFQLRKLHEQYIFTPRPQPKRKWF